MPLTPFALAAGDWPLALAADGWPMALAAGTDG